MRFKNILVTGAAGFIGYHLCIKLIKEGFKIVGYDNLNDYYDLSLKKKRLQIITEISKGKDFNWTFDLFRKIRQTSWIGVCKN